MLQRHGDDIDADDEGDDQVQVVAGTQSVDSQPGRTVWRIVGQLLGLWRGRVKKKETEDLKQGKDFVFLSGQEKKKNIDGMDAQMVNESLDVER